MKKLLTLVLFLFSSSSLLQAKGGLEEILGGPEENLHLGITRAIKKQKVRVLDEFSGSPVLPELKKQYEMQIIALGEIIKKHSTIPASSSGHLSTSAKVDVDLYYYNNAKTKIKMLKQQLTPKAKLQLRTGFASLPLEGALIESVRYGIGLKNISAPALESFQIEFHKHDYHQFVEWKNYACYLIDVAADFKEKGHIEKSREYNKAAFRIYEEILPVGRDAFYLLREQKLSARIYNSCSQTTGELGGLLSTDELLESSYFEAGTLALTLGHTVPGLNFLLWSQGLARVNKIDRPHLPYLIAHGYHNLGVEHKDPGCFRLAAASYDEYFTSLDSYIQKASVALSAEKTVEAESWMRKVIGSLQVTGESDKLKFQNIFRVNAKKLATIAFKAKDCRTALYFFESIIQNEAIFNQEDMNSSMLCFNTGAMAYLAEENAKARFYLKMVNREDPLIVADTRLGVSIDTWLKEIDVRERRALSGVSPSSSIEGPSTSYES